MTKRKPRVGKWETRRGTVEKPQRTLGPNLSSGFRAAGGPVNRPAEGLGRNAKAWCYQCDSEHRWEVDCDGRQRAV